MKLEPSLSYKWTPLLESINGEYYTGTVWYKTLKEALGYIPMTGTKIVGYCRYAGKASKS